MNVSKSIDWQHMNMVELTGHRFIGQLWSGAMLDSHLRLKLDAEGRANLVDSDAMSTVFRSYHDHLELNKNIYKSINVLEETK